PRPRSSGAKAPTSPTESPSSPPTEALTRRPPALKECRQPPRQPPVPATQQGHSGVTANLKGSWHILTLDRHFQGCDAQRLGNIADGVAVTRTKTTGACVFLSSSRRSMTTRMLPRSCTRPSSCCAHDCRTASVGSELTLSST